jgi:transcriptional regulator with XRE-family HTH domain
MQLNSLLKRKNLSQYELSKKSGISQGLISDYNANRKKPGETNLVKLALALECSLDELLELSGEEPRPNA